MSSNCMHFKLVSCKSKRSQFCVSIIVILIILILVWTCCGFSPDPPKVWHTTPSLVYLRRPPHPWTFSWRWLREMKLTTSSSASLPKWRLTVTGRWENKRRAIDRKMWSQQCDCSFQRGLSSLMICGKMYYAHMMEIESYRFLEQL